MTTHYLTEFLPTTELIANFKLKLENLKLHKYLISEQPTLSLEQFTVAEQQVLRLWAENNTDSAIDRILEAIETLDTVLLTCAIPLPDSSLETISVFLSGIINKPVALQVTIDSSIVGGAVLGYKGKAASYTLADLFNKQKTHD